MNLRPTDGYENCPNNSDFWRVMVPTPATWGLSADSWMIALHPVDGSEIWLTSWYGK